MHQMSSFEIYLYFYAVIPNSPSPPPPKKSPPPFFFLMHIYLKISSKDLCLHGQLVNWKLLVWGGFSILVIFFSFLIFTQNAFGKIIVFFFFLFDFENLNMILDTTIYGFMFFVF